MNELIREKIKEQVVEGGLAACVLVTREVAEAHGVESNYGGDDEERAAIDHTVLSVYPPNGEHDRPHISWGAIEFTRLSRDRALCEVFVDTKGWTTHYIMSGTGSDAETGALNRRAREHMQLVGDAILNRLQAVGLIPD